MPNTTTGGTNKSGIKDDIFVTLNEGAEEAGVKGPDPDQWGDAARRDRGAHPDDDPQPEEPDDA